jgi:hypothetical protein
MKKKILGVLLATVFLFSSFTSFAEAVVKVRGYYRRNGIRIPSHYRTSPNRYKWDNWSSWGNYNPFTGKKGYKRWQKW